MNIYPVKLTEQDRERLNPCVANDRETRRFLKSDPPKADVQKAAILELERWPRQRASIIHRLRVRVGQLEWSEVEARIHDYLHERKSP